MASNMDEGDNPFPGERYERVEPSFKGPEKKDKLKIYYMYEKEDGDIVNFKLKPVDCSGVKGVKAILAVQHTQPSQKPRYAWHASRAILESECSVTVTNEKEEKNHYEVTLTKSGNQQDIKGKFLTRSL